MAAVVLAIRRFRDGRPEVVGLVLLVLVTAFFAGAAPRLVDRVGTDALRGEVSAATDFQSNLQLIQERRYEANRNGDPLQPVAAEGDTLESEIPPTVRRLIDDQSYLVDSIRWRIRNPTPDPSFARLRVQPGALDRIRLVAGRLPTGKPATIPVDPTTTPPTEEIPVIEAALSVESLRAIGSQVGDRIVLRPDTSDILVGRSGSTLDAAIDIVGAFEVTNEADRWWLDDTSLSRPGIRTLGGDSRLIDVTPLISSDAYAAMLTATIAYPNRYTWRYYVAVDRFESGDLPRLVPELRRLDGVFPSSAGTTINEGTSLRSGLLPLLTTADAHWRSSLAVLTVVGLGPAAVGIAALAMVGSLVMRRRLPALALSRARGASTGQLIAEVALEGLVLSLPAALLAIALVSAVLPAGPSQLSILASVAAATVTTIVLLAAAAPTAMALPHGPGQQTRIAGRPSARRILIEGLIVFLGVAGVILLRERGAAAASSTAVLGGVDPFVAAVPALAGIAASIVAVRLLPAPIAVLSRLAAIRRDLVPVLALRRVTRGGAGRAVLVVLLVTSTVGAFAASILVYLDGAAEAVAWQEVGAPYRLSQPDPLPKTLDPLKLPGVEAAAGLDAIASFVTTRYLPLQVIAIDAADYERLVAGTPADPHLPAEMLASSFDGSIPVIVSPELTTSDRGVAVGGTLSLIIGGRLKIDFTVARVVESFPSIAPGQPFVVISRQQLNSLANVGQFRDTTSYLLRASDAAWPDLRAALRVAAPVATLQSRAERAASIRSSPIVRSLVAGVAASSVVAFAYAALAVAAGLALVAAARSVEVAHLRALGLTRREVFALNIVEHGPTILVAAVIGTALGLGLFALLRDALGLTKLIGTSVDVNVGIGVGQLSVVFLSIVIIVAVGIGLGATLQRAATPVAAVRRGFE